MTQFHVPEFPKRLPFNPLASVSASSCPSAFRHAGEGIATTPEWGPVTGGPGPRGPRWKCICLGAFSKTQTSGPSQEGSQPYTEPAWTGPFPQKNR